MTKRYHGKNNFASIKPKNKNERMIYAQSNPKHINFIFKIVETHPHTAIPVQIDPELGIIAFHTTSSLESTLLSILESIPRSIKIIT